MDVPMYTIDLLKELERLYPDVMELDEDVVGTPQYWKEAGVIELLRMLKTEIENKQGGVT